MMHLLDEFLQIHKYNDYFFLWFLNHLSHYGAAPLARADKDYFDFFKKHFDEGSMAFKQNG